MSVNIHLKTGVKATSEGPVSADTKCPTIAEFEGVYQEIQKFLLDDARKKMECDENRIRYLGKMMDTTVLGGKYNRGMTVVEIGHQLAIATGASKARYAEIVHQCAVCGWIIEFLQAHFLVEDDIMDSSKTRRGKPCWYLHPGVTTQCAINDGMILLGWCTVMAQHFFAGKSFQREVLDLLHDADYRTLFGQFYDVTGMVDSSKLDPDVKVETTDDFTEFTISNYKRIVKFKTAYYTYFAPLSLGKAVCHDLVDSARLDVEPFSLLVGEYLDRKSVV
jgi:farnesyl diphosphate synthase